MAQNKSETAPIKITVKSDTLSEDGYLYSQSVPDQHSEKADEFLNLYAKSKQFSRSGSAKHKKNSESALSSEPSNSTKNTTVRAQSAPLSCKVTIGFTACNNFESSSSDDDQIERVADGEFDIYASRITGVSPSLDLK